MKYFGEKSLSSFLSVVFSIGWYVVLVASVILAICGLMFIFASGHDGAGLGSEKWDNIRSVPAIVKVLFLVYFGVVVTLLLKIIRKSQQLFANFKQEVLFDQSNVNNTAEIGKLMVWFAVLTLDLGTLFVSLLLLMLCELFKSGAQLQQEHDLTI